MKTNNQKKAHTIFLLLFRIQHMYMDIKPGNAVISQAAHGSIQKEIWLRNSSRRNNAHPCGHYNSIPQHLESYQFLSCK